MLPRMTDVFESKTRWKARRGMTVYHVSSVRFGNFHDRPTWFTPSLDQVDGYRKGAGFAGPSPYVYVCELQTDRIAYEEDVEPFVRQVWPNEEVEPLYSKFDARVGEYRPDEIRKFIGLLEQAGFEGCIHLDYDANDSQSDVYTLVLFHPTRSAKIVEVRE